LCDGGRRRLDELVRRGGRPGQRRSLVRTGSGISAVPTPRRQAGFFFRTGPLVGRADALLSYCEIVDRLTGDPLPSVREVAARLPAAAESYREAMENLQQQGSAHELLSVDVLDGSRRSRLPFRLLAEIVELAGLASEHLDDREALVDAYESHKERRSTDRRSRREALRQVGF
jgi:hypothetical protein